MVEIPDDVLDDDAEDEEFLPPVEPARAEPQRIEDNEGRLKILVFPISEALAYQLRFM